ncbi:C45 family peptidase [Methanocalculus sp.]|uniref:C45 family autoproteolytic acyltransferase/hydolase n=1 Tax=Methanocalculus sp. TaxID=2004547 RepID=UPI00261A1AA3|nr:C45 family peptidase [Methanocalculus sp.]MDG6251522.1 C45 family autoproteolytic acyltransferase/hydrolase [Methanocalculus sp.]
MRILYIFIVLALVAPAMAIMLTPENADGADTDIGLKKVAVFGNGIRYEAGSYHVVVLSGTYREMGQQFGALMKDELREEYAMLRSHFTASGYTEAEVSEYAQTATAFQAKRMKEIRAGIAEMSDLSVDEVNILYQGPIVYLTTFGAKAGCSFMAVWGDYTPDGSVVLSRNYDLPDVFSVFYPYYTLTIYNPTDGSNGVATFGPAGARPETLMNSAGLFIADDNAADSGGEIEIAGRPDLIGEFFRMMLDYSDMDELDAGIMSTRANTAWIVNAAGPDRAYSYEETVYDIKQREGAGVIAAANHFVDPSWRLAAPPAEHSTSRYANLLRLAEENRGSIDGERMVAIRDVQVEECGATFRHSMLGGMLYSSEHQVVYVPETRMLWMKVVDRDWQKVDLGNLFSV